MEKRSKATATVKQESEKTNNEISQEISSQKLKTDNNYEEAEKGLNSKILKITMIINDEYPELSKYLEEMPVTIPVDNKPEITLHNLNAYYESLNVLLNKYIKEHS
jgi:hypothetical protein